MTKGYTPDGYEFTATYDAENRLSSIEYTDSQSTVHKAEYIYSGYGFLAQIKKYENASPTGDIRLIRSGYLTIQERDASNQVVNEYTWGKNMGGGIGGLLSMTQSGSLYTYLYDGRGNVSALLNTSQQVAAAYRYDAFGNLMAKTGSLDQPFGFSTKRYDAGTGLSYYGYRFYNPAIGKWLTRDPIGEAGGINLYGFVYNNPVNSIDPFGLADYHVSWTNVGASKSKAGGTHISGIVVSMDRNSNNLHNVAHFSGTFAGLSIGAPIGGSYTRSAIFKDGYDSGDVTRIAGYSSFTSLTSSLFGKGGISIGLYAFGDLHSASNVFSEVEGFEFGFASMQGNISLEGEVLEITPDTLKEFMGLKDPLNPDSSCK